MTRIGQKFAAAFGLVLGLAATGTALAQKQGGTLKVTGEDHEGGGWVQVFQVRDGKFVKETDWFRAYPEVVANAVKKSE